MIAVGMLIIWAGYGLTTWGYVLVRGWDIPFREWFSPLHPYQWPASGDPPAIPPTQVLPTGQKLTVAQQRAAARSAPASSQSAGGALSGLIGGAAGGLG